MRGWHCAISADGFGSITMCPKALAAGEEVSRQARRKTPPKRHSRAHGSHGQRMVEESLRNKKKMVILGVADHAMRVNNQSRISDLLLVAATQVSHTSCSRRWASNHWHGLTNTQISSFNSFSPPSKSLHLILLGQSRNCLRQKDREVRRARRSRFALTFVKLTSIQLPPCPTQLSRKSENSIGYSNPSPGLSLPLPIILPSYRQELQPRPPPQITQCLRILRSRKFA